jgi:mycothiol synthase
MSAEVRPFRLEDEAGLRSVMAAALEVDRYPGYSAWDLDIEARSILGAPDGTAVAVEDGVVCGYVCSHDSLTVHPDYRRRGHGTRLFAAGMELAAREALAEISLAVPSSGPARSFAEAMGMTYHSTLWRLELPAEAAVPAPAFPDAFVGRQFGPWLPLPELVGLLNACFVEHPSPMSWRLSEIEYAHGRPEFDPTAMLLLVPAATPNRSMGFVRTSVAPLEAGETAPVGEIRLVGVLPEWRGRGLGRELLRWGVAHLRAGGAGRIQLTVEARNELALELYRRNGFVPEIEWPHWARPVAAGIGS